MDSLPEETGIGAIDVCPFHETGAASRAMQLFYRKDPLMMRRKHFLIAFVSLFLPMLLSFFGLSRLEKPLIERSLSAPKEGFVLKIQNGGIAKTFTVRRIASGVGVEKTFPIHSPWVEKIDVIRRGKVRRARLNYMRGRTGKAAKIKTRD